MGVVGKVIGLGVGVHVLDKAGVFKTLKKKIKKKSKRRRR